MSKKVKEISEEKNAEAPKVKGYFYTDEQVNKMLAVISEVAGKHSIPLHQLLSSGKETEV